MTGRKVLIVEDEADIRDVVGEILQLYGYSVSVAPDGLEGWKLAGSNTYDLIITDLGIPGINGLDLVQKVRAASIATPVLIITGVIFENAEEETRAFKPCAVLLKPFKIEDLMNKIAAFSVESELKFHKVGKAN